MRVVHVEFGRHLYGGARQVLDLVAGLARRGVDNVLVCARDSAVAKAHVGAEVVALPVRGDLDVAAIARLKRALAAARPDLVHVHSRRGADWHGAAASLGARWAAVVTRRVDAVELRPAARLKYSRYDAVIAISRAIEAQLVERVGLPRARVHVVPSGVDTRLFRPDPEARVRLVERIGVADDAVLVGVVAQLIPRKGHATLLAALPELVRRHPRLLVLAFGQGPLERRLGSQLAGTPLERHVRLLGFRADLPALLPGLDVVAHPATAEGLGLAVLEALAAGVPVVASGAGGIADVIEDGAEGLLVPGTAPDAWVAALDRLIGSPDLRRRMGEAGRRRIEEAFTVDRMVEGNLAVYRAALERRAARAADPAPRTESAGRTTESR